jgi:hypothetical protein
MHGDSSAHINFRWKIHAAYLVLLCGVIVLTWFCADFMSSIRQMDLEDQIKDIAFLMDQYAQHRDESGEWPGAEKLYGNRLSLKSSVASGDTRIDTYFSPPRLWVRYRLKDNGSISFDVSWEQFPDEATTEQPRPHD